MGELHELVVLALSLVWFAGATPEQWVMRWVGSCVMGHAIGGVMCVKAHHMGGVMSSWVITGVGSCMESPI